MNKENNNKVELLENEENKLADQLRSMCDDKGRELNSKSSVVFHKLAQNYLMRGSDNLNLIKTVALYNAAIVRSSSNKHEIENELREFCNKILKQVEAKQPNEDLVEAGKRFKKRFIQLRLDVSESMKSVSGTKSRKSIKHLVEIRKLQNKIATDYTKIMADLSQYCQNVMGEAPCKFAVVGMGSLARNEITPYSDFEHIIVLEDGIQSKPIDDEILDYFRWFSIIFHVIIINLRETILPSVSIDCLNNKDSKHGDWFYDDITPRGISFDGMMPHACKFPLGRQEHTTNKPWKTELIKPVSEMLKYLTTEEDLKNGYHLKDILTRVCFVYGDESIFDDFQSKMHLMLEQDDDEQSKVESIKQQILEDLEHFSTRSTIPEIISSKEFNLKKVIYRSTTLFISALGRLHNIRASSSFEIVEQLADKNEISESAKHKLMYAVGLACELRLKWYMQCKSQTDSVKCDDSSEKTAVKMFAKFTSNERLISYFQIAYALQCDIAKRLNLKKKYFYANPELLNVTLYHGLEEMEKLVQSTLCSDKSNHDKTERLYTFDECMEQLQSDNSQNQTEYSLFYQQLQSVKELSFLKVMNEFAVMLYYDIFGNHLFRIKKYDEALEHFEHENQMLKKMKDDLGIDRKSYVDLKKIKKVFKIKPTVKNRKKSKVHVQQIRSFHKPSLIAIVQQYAISWRDIGRCSSLIDKPKRGLDCLFQSLENLESIRGGNEINFDITLVLNLIGECFIKNEDLKTASVYLKRSLNIQKRVFDETDSNQNRMKAMTLHHIGKYLFHLKQYDNAIDHLKQSLEIQEKLPCESNNFHSITLFEVGSCLMKKEDYNKALDYFTRAYSYEVGQDNIIFEILYMKGCCLAIMDRLDEAMTCFNRALQIDDQILFGNDPEIVKDICLKAGICLMKMSKTTETNQYYERAKEISDVPK